jgi:hypothetical protein
MTYRNPAIFLIQRLLDGGRFQWFQPFQLFHA